MDDPGGGFWTGYSLNDQYLFSSSDEYALSNIDYLLDESYGIGLSLSGPTGHAVTAWGYEYNENNGNYEGIYITDSDDGVDELRYYDVAYTDSVWYLQDYYGYNSYYISEVHGLSMTPFLTEGTDSSQILGDASVPLPAPIILLGSGLIGFLGMRRRLK